MKPSGIVTLLTDFGQADPYVGVMKGNMLRRFPGAVFVDLTHAVPAQNVALASFWLERSYRWFPAGTVHLVVVDPGVGSARRPLALKLGGHYFVVPDNGVFDRLLLNEAPEHAWVIEPEQLGIGALSATFHGRDLFGPTAAELARGTLTLESMARAEPAVTPHVVEEPAADASLARIVAVDHFGNLITDFDAERLVPGSSCRVHAAGQLLPLMRTYADANPGECMALVGSFDTLEIAARDSSAARLLGLTTGDTVRVAAD